jgi:uncharacterized membrane protein
MKKFILDSVSGIITVTFVIAVTLISLAIVFAIAINAVKLLVTHTVLTCIIIVVCTGVFYGNISRIVKTFDKVFEKIREIGKK